MVERLIFLRAEFCRYRLPPFLGVVEYRIDVENYTPERVDAMAHHLTDCKFREPNAAIGRSLLKCSTDFPVDSPPLSKLAMRHLGSGRRTVGCCANASDLKRPRVRSTIVHRDVCVPGPWSPPSLVRSRITFACFQVASSCILPSIIAAPVPSGIAARMRLANATSAASRLNTRFAISIWLGCKVRAPRSHARRRCGIEPHMPRDR